MTKDEFMHYYANNSGVSVQGLTELGLFAEPCDRGDELCKGWQMMSPGRKREVTNDQQD
jgi:hypothetical protein